VLFGIVTRAATPGESNPKRSPGEQVIPSPSAGETFARRRGCLSYQSPQPGGRLAHRYFQLAAGRIVPRR